MMRFYVAEIIATVALVGMAVAGLAMCVEGCAKPPVMPDDVAEGAYGAELLRCVDEAETLAESKACRAEVDRKWGVTQTATDGGAR